MNLICKICKYKFNDTTNKTLIRSIKFHLSRIHKYKFIDLLQYYVNNFNCSFLNKENIKTIYYDRENSCREIAQYFNENYKFNLFLNKFDKSDIIKIMKAYNMQTRNTSDAKLLHIKKCGQWCTGRTKYDHPSIMKISLNHMGNKNPMYGKRGSDIIKNSKKFKAMCESEEHRKVLSDAGKKWWKENNIKGIWQLVGYNSWQEWFNSKSVDEKNRLKEALSSGGSKAVRNSGKNKPSKFEQEVCRILKSDNVEFITQKIIKFNNVKRYVVDIFIEKYNLIIECFGDWYHCNPSKYKSDFYNPAKKQLANEIWNYDNNRIKNLESMGYKVIVIWESEIYRKEFNYMKNIVLSKIKKYLE